jgi:hypothetical protein
MYRYLSFDGVDLPTALPIDDLSSAQSESAIVQALNGNVDILGDSIASQKPQILEYSGTYVSSTFLISDPNIIMTGDGYFLVTEFGDFIVEDLGTDFVSDVWRKRRGLRSVLVRQRENDASLEWTHARLMYFEAKRVVYQADAILPVRLIFEIIDDRWRAMTLTTVTAAIAASTNVTVTTTSDVMIDDAIIEVEAVTYNIDLLDITKTGDTHLTFDADVAPYVYSPVQPGNLIRFDCGQYIIETETGVTRYVFFSFGVTHTIQNWLELQPGANTITFAITYSTGGGAATARIMYYEQST